MMALMMMHAMQVAVSMCLTSLRFRVFKCHHPEAFKEKHHDPEANTHAGYKPEHDAVLARLATGERRGGDVSPLEPTSPKGAASGGKEALSVENCQAGHATPAENFR